MDKRATLTPPGLTRAAKRGNPIARERTQGGQPGAPVNIRPAPAMARCDAKTYTYSVTAGESVKVADYNENRGYFMLQNNGVGNVWVSYGTPARANRGYLLRPGGYIEPLSAPCSEIFFAGDNTGDIITVILGTDI